MQTFTRRQVLKTITTAVVGNTMMKGSAFGQSQKSRNQQKKIPIIHIADLYHPPQDPDDHIDLATIMALPEFDLQGVVLDITQKFLDPAPKGFDIVRDPGYVPVSQLSYLTGKTIPVAMGSKQPLRNPKDDASNASLREQAGINFVLDTLEQSDDPVVITLGGSARVITAAYNRNPELVHLKTKAVVLNAGATGGSKKEWNVMLDTAAFVGLWRSGLPIHWYPCATDKSAFDRSSEYGTYWKTTHADLFKNIPVGLRDWFCFGFSGNLSGEIIRSMNEQGAGSVWQTILEGNRNMWSTISLVMTAGRVLAKTPEGWRFVPKDQVNAQWEQWDTQLNPIEANVDADGRVAWQNTQGKNRAWIFKRKAGPGYGTAMTEALNHLLCSIKM